MSTGARRWCSREAQREGDRLVSGEPTYVLLELQPDGDVRTFRSAIAPSRMDWLVMVDPVASGHDRGPYRTYEVAGYSIDVMRLPGEAQQA